MNTNALRNIREFPDLVNYLRDELNWPIDVYDFDQLTYEYDPTELGIDSNAAVNIEEIKQLRPLLDDQPWGIFFVKFAPKRLPVVALRRILSSLAIKKKASARVSERASWKINDLLFISSFGEVAQRQITFAHFSQDEHSVELPTLRVLGWDEADTFLHIDHVQKELHYKLAWPENEKDIESWRSNWAGAFTLGHREVITTSKELAVRLAVLAKQIRNRTNSILSIETENGPIKRLHHAFRESLIHDLSEDDFADMYAQTIAYGLLSARLANPRGRTADELTVQIPVTNPFLKELMETFLNVGGRKAMAGEGGIDFDELGISEVVDLLNNSNMEAVIRDFGDKNPQEDPVIHFYELFLKEYDAKKRMQRGVFYTPRPVVSYIVRSVDELLRTEFGLEDGLADITTWGEMLKRHKGLKIPKGVSPDQDFVQILDPATGTGTFLVEAIDLIHKTLVAKWKSHGHSSERINAFWNEYIPKHLLTRLHGYELLMAPYVITHLKIGLKLYETGYRFGSDVRARVYLTNSLEPAQDFSGRFEYVIPALAHEAQSVNNIKKDTRFTIVIGNPPYSGLSANMSNEAAKLIEPYKYIAGVHFNERKHWLHDDYVKFLRFSENCLILTGIGIIGLITNHAFYDNPTFRGLRWNLLQTFNKMYLLDLHGNAMKREKAPESGEDKNVFDIQQGVAISLFAKTPFSQKKIVIQGDLWGSRKDKYFALSHGTPCNLTTYRLNPNGEFYLFVPRLDDYAEEYESAVRLNEVFMIFAGGFITARDHFVIDFDDRVLLKRIESFIDPKVPDALIREQFFKGCGSDKYLDGDTRGWKVPEARKQIRQDQNWRKHIHQCLYRPFDIRWIYWTDSMIDWPRPEVNGHLLNEGNRALVFMRQVASGDGYSHFIVSRLPVDNRACYSNKGILSLAPLYLHESFAKHHGELCFDENKTRPNFTPAFSMALRYKLGCDAAKLTPEDIFNYAYAVFHSPSYRLRYADFLKIDFPRLPLTGDMDLFCKLAQLGDDLVTLHLFESSKLEHLGTQYCGNRTLKVEKASWSNNTIWIDTNQTAGFRVVYEDVWNFQIGGYQVCEKWLKDRKGRTLSEEDINHYQKIVVALSETIRLMQEIDQVIEEHGGWPGAFKQS